MLMYTASLKRPVTERRESKQKAVDDLLDQLGLSACKGVKIGDPLQKGISGGQVRITIGCMVLRISDSWWKDCRNDSFFLTSFLLNWRFNDHIILFDCALCRPSELTSGLPSSPSPKSYSWMSPQVVLTRTREFYKLNILII